jgi:competence ComEA-like helix-hairpin-helix protein
MGRRAAGLLLPVAAALLVAVGVARFRLPIRADEITPRRTGVALDLNAADAATLALLPGVGPGLAHRIVEHRRRHGGFTRPEEIENVPGVGHKTAERLLPFVVCGAVREKEAGGGAPGGAVDLGASGRSGADHH